MKYIFLRYPEGKFKAVTLSYDDGQYHDVRLAQTLDKYGLKGTFNLCSKRIGQETPSRRLTVEEIMAQHRALYGPDRTDVAVPLPQGAKPAMPYWMK